MDVSRLAMNLIYVRTPKFHALTKTHAFISSVYFFSGVHTKSCTT